MAAGAGKSPEAAGIDAAETRQVRPAHCDGSNPLEGGARPAKDPVRRGSRPDPLPAQRRCSPRRRGGAVKAANAGCRRRWLVESGVKPAGDASESLK
jgi:hypothetical protein